MDLRLIRMFAMVCPFAISARECSKVRDLVLRARVISRSVVTVAAVVFSWGAASNVALAQCEETAEFLPADGAENDNAGNAVSISGDVVVVGVYKDDDGGTSSGSAYVLRKSGSTWIEEQKLTASDAASYDFFGSSVVVEGDIAVVGAPNTNHDGVADVGTAYIFRRSGSSWVEEQKLLALDGARLDLFGGSVAISGDTIIVGASNENNNGVGDGMGAAYVFRSIGGTWVQEQKLVADDRALVDYFGTSVAISGDTVIVGAYFNDDNGSASGSAYIFRRTGSTWVQEQKLLASNGAAADLFGYSVAVYGALAVVGAYQDDDNGINFGSAYVFRFNGSTWIEETELYGSDSATNDSFAFSVSVGVDVAVIGAPDHDGRGAVYVFRKIGSSWVEEQKLLASDGAQDDSLGSSVTMSGDEIVAGAPGNWENVWGAGSAYIFATDGTVGEFDLSIVLGAWGPNPGHPADLNGDGVVSAPDLALVLGAWGTCP